MNRDRFSLETVIYIVLGLIFLGVFINYYSAAFPSASIRLEVTKDEAQQVATEFLQQRGFDLAEYESAIVFDASSAGAIFLQKTQGMEKANEMMASGVPIWRWHCRWFRSGEKEEFRVYVAPDGNVRRFTHSTKDDAEGATIAQEDAEGIAVDYLRDVARIDLDEYERVQASSKKQENRTDHSFEWKQKGFEITWKEDDPEAGTGSIRVAVNVTGDQIGHYNRYFKTPEAFTRDHQKTMSRGQLLSIISLALMFFTGVAALIVFIKRYKAEDIRWRFALIFAAVVVGLMVLNSANTFPLAKMAYQTIMGYGVFMGIILIVSIMGAVVYGAFILFTGASGDSLTREVYPNSLSTIQDLVQGRLFTRSYFFASVRGYAFGFFFLGYITLFYLVGRRYLGVFVPAEGPYSNLLATYLPWLAPLAISLMAAVSEEFVSRLFSISFLKRYLKWTWVALLIPAMIWAFGHSSYPIFPVYVRGIELTIGGILFGIMFLRFNIMTCIIAHYAIDAIFIGLPLLKSGNPYYVTSGVIVCLLAVVPLLLGIPGFFKSEPQPQEPAAA